MHPYFQKKVEQDTVHHFTQAQNTHIILEYTEVSKDVLTSLRQSHAAPTPATDPLPLPAASATEPPSVLGAGDRRGEKYTRGWSA